MKKRFLFFGNFVLLVSMFFVASLANAQGFTTLGVGISTPTGTFHVHNANSTDGNEGIRQLSLNPVSYEATMHLTNAATGTAKTDGLLITLLDNVLTMKHQESANFNIVGSNGNGITITSDGDVGVGTASPLQKFHVNGASQFNGTMDVLSKTTIGSDCQTVTVGKAHDQELAYGSGFIGFNANRTGTTWTSQSNTWLNGGAVIWATMNGDILFANINSTGSSVQTLSDTDLRRRVNLKLGANGVLMAKEVVVTMDNWPDYVFENGYKFNSLEETERYINDNGHLPGVPSASEVETDGVNLGEMNKILLQKIEELTLQVIELNKQINELKGE